MPKYQSIALIYGSDTSETEISRSSGEFVASNIDGSRYDIYEIYARFGNWSLIAYKKHNAIRQTFAQSACPQIDKNDFSVCIHSEKIKFDYAYIVQHGSPGENGLIQGYLEMLSIPFNTCSAFVSNIAFDKFACKSFVRQLNVVTLAPDVFVREGMDIERCVDTCVEQLKFPVFVKPTQSGSSFGVTRVLDKSDLAQAIRFAFKENPSVIIEQGIEGREFTCAAYFDGESVKALPLLEIVSENAYFDYEAKYLGHSQEICPAPISEEHTDLIQKTTCKIYSEIACKGVVRMDYILADDALYFLEINTIPGMTSSSMLPNIVRTAGMNMTDFLTTIIESEA